MHGTPRAGRTQRGNILFIILLAVVLFAALNYAVTSSMRGGGNDASPEKHKTQIADIQNYAAGMQSAIIRMTLTGATPLYMVDFNTPNRTLKDGTSALYNNTSCTSTMCEIFHQDGGALAYRDFSGYKSIKETTPSNWIAPGHHTVQLERWENVGSDLPELVLVITRLDQDLGKAINQQYHGKDTVSISQSGANQVFYSAMTDAMVQSTSIGFARTGTDIAGKTAFCAFTTNNPTYGTYSDCYFVIIAR